MSNNDQLGLDNPERRLLPRRRQSGALRMLLSYPRVVGGGGRPGGGGVRGEGQVTSLVFPPLLGPRGGNYQVRLDPLVPSMEVADGQKGEPSYEHFISMLMLCVFGCSEMRSVEL